MSIKPNNHTIGRLTQANTQTFTYDAAGNNQHHNTTYNTSNNQLLEDNTFTYTYAPQGHFLASSGHKKGNLARKIDKQTQELYIYKYNALNQLIHHYKATAEDRYIYKTDYLYDALNRRIVKTTYTKATDSTTSHRYLYHNENIIAILDNTKEEPTLLASIVHHPSRTDTPLSITNHTTNQTYYYHRDHQGSIVALTNEQGNIVEHITYDGHYGKILNHSKEEKTFNPYGYTGRETDQSDLYYYRARYYDPNTQRFLSSDPIEFEAGDFNFYRYVSNDPVNFVDPSGLESCECKLIRATESKWKQGKDGRYKTWLKNGEDTGKKTNSFEYYNGKSPGDKVAQGIGKGAVNTVDFVKAHPDSVGLGLSVGAAVLEGPLAVGMGLCAIAIDVAQEDEVGQAIGGGALAADVMGLNPKAQAAAIAIDIGYGIGQLF